MIPVERPVIKSVLNSLEKGVFLFSKELSLNQINTSLEIYTFVKFSRKSLNLILHSVNSSDLFAQNIVEFLSVEVNSLSVFAKSLLIPIGISFPRLYVYLNIDLIPIRLILNCNLIIDLFPLLLS